MKGVYLVMQTCLMLQNRDFCCSDALRDACISLSWHMFQKHDVADASHWGFTLPGVPFAGLGCLSQIDASNWGGLPFAGVG